MPPRLEPISEPPGLFMRVAYAMSKRQFGKIISPLKVIYSRKPRLLPIALQMQRTLEHGLSLDPSLRVLVQVQASRINHCSFCEDLALAQAVRDKIGAERFAALDDVAISNAFTARERAALAYTAEITRDREVRDDTFAELRRHFNETEIVELTWVNAMENYFNLQAHALGIVSDQLLTSRPGHV